VEVYGSSDELPAADKALLNEAREIAKVAYALTLIFCRGSGSTHKWCNHQGTNQENASYPVGICAERALMSAAATHIPELGSLRWLLVMTIRMEQA